VALMPMSSCYPRIKEGEVLAAQRRHRAQHTAAGEAAAAQVAACLDSLQAEAQVRHGHMPASHSVPCPSMSALHLVPYPSTRQSVRPESFLRFQPAHSSTHSLLTFAGGDRCSLGRGEFALHKLTGICTLQRFNVAAERLGLVAPGGGAGKRAAGVMYEARVDATASAAADILSADLKVHRIAMCSTLCGFLMERGHASLGRRWHFQPSRLKAYQLHCRLQSHAKIRSRGADTTGCVCFIVLTTIVLTSRDAGHALQGAVIPGLQAARQGYKDREVRLTGERFRVENRLADLVEAERCQFQENLQLEHRVGRPQDPGSMKPAWHFCIRTVAL
jgi:hypothetical protein